MTEPLSRRLTRIAELLRQELGTILVEDLRDPRIGFVTLMRVEITSDLREARVYVSLLGSDAQQRTSLRGLNSARGRIQRLLSERVELRWTPALTFVEDRGVKHSVRISNLLNELNVKSADSNAERESESGESEREARDDAGG